MHRSCTDPLRAFVLCVCCVAVSVSESVNRCMYSVNILAMRVLGRRAVGDACLRFDSMADISSMLLIPVMSLLRGGCANTCPKPVSLPHQLSVQTHTAPHSGRVQNYAIVHHMAINVIRLGRPAASPTACVELHGKPSKRQLAAAAEQPWQWH